MSDAKPRVGKETRPKSVAVYYPLPPTYTTAEAARLLGVARPTVTLHCRKLGIAKHGTAWLIDSAALDALRSSIVGKRGNPNWVKP